MQNIAKCTQPAAIYQTPQIGN